MIDENSSILRTKILKIGNIFPKKEEYKTIRDVFSHNPYANYPTTVKLFKKLFGNKLEFKIVQKTPKKINKQTLNKKIIIDQSLRKNDKILNEIAQEFIKELKKKYNLNN